VEATEAILEAAEAVETTVQRLSMTEAMKSVSQSGQTWRLQQQPQQTVEAAEAITEATEAVETTVQGLSMAEAME
jgi:hypothetical protein